MKFLRFLLIAAFSAGMVFTLACQKAEEQKQGETSPANKSEFEGATAKLDTLFNEGKASDYANEYASDAISNRGSGKILVGSSGIGADVENLLKTFDAKRETKTGEILAGSDFAIEKGTYSLNSTTKTGSMSYFETGHYVICRKKIGGKWLIAWDFWISDQVPANPGSPKDTRKDEKKEDKK